MVCDKTELALLALPADMNCLVAEPRTRVIAKDADIIAAQHRIVLFKGSVMIEVPEPYSHFILLTKEHFERIAHPLLGWVKQLHLNGVFAHLAYTAKDLSDNDHLALFGNLVDTKADLTVWDMDKLEVRSDIAPEDCVRRSPYSMKRRGNPIPFIMQLAGSDNCVYDDIMQSLAPLVMALKPEGIIWWTGDGVDGKSALMDALHQLFPDQLASITNKRLAGGRVTRTLNGNLGNIVDGDNGQVADIHIYRSLAKHQSFNVHNYHRQDGLEIQSNIHHIFAAADAPRFSSKSWSTQWRTFAIPFNQQIGCSQAHIFTDEFFGQLIAEMCRYAQRIKMHGYRYNWSGAASAERTKPIPAVPAFRW
jgi:hypothetical protein